MQHRRFGRFQPLVLLLALLTALTAACASDDQAAQPQQQRQTQQTVAAERPQAEAAQESESTAQAAPADDEAAAADDEQPQRATTTTSTTTSTTTATGTTKESEQSAAAEKDSQQQTTASSTADSTAEQQAEESPAAQQQAEPQQQDDGQAAQATQPAPEPSDERQAPQQDSQEQEMTPEAEQEEQQAEQPSGPTAAERLQLRAEEIRAQATVPDLTGLTGWLNGEETTIALELAKGNVVLIDFWTYTCINCVRTLPFLTAWDAKYREHGLVILGVHTPEFEFEKVPANIRAAIAEHGIEYDVPMDNDYGTWRAFRNRYWPAKYLIGPTDDGSPMGLRYAHFGEGDYDGTEREIRAALEAAGRDLSGVPFGVDVTVPNRNAPARQTRELYAGWRRNVGGGGPYAGQDAYFLGGLGAETLYRDIPTAQREHNLWYLQGLWRTESEAVVHARTTEGLEDYFAFIFRGRTANVVLTVAANGDPFNVYVQLDGRWLFPNEAGAHIRWDDRDRSYIRVTENDLYRLVYLPEWSEHEIRLSSNSDQFRIFALTFGSYVGGE